VDKLVKNAECMFEFIDEKVMKDHDDFLAVVEKYESDADVINGMFHEFSINTGEIRDTISSMNVGLNDISTAVDESAKEVTATAGQAVNLAAAISNIQLQTNKNKEVSEMLSNEVGCFKNI